MTSIVLPREPVPGDIFTGQVTHEYTDHPGFLVSAEIPLFLPFAAMEAEQRDSVGRWVECEVIEVVREKRAVVVRPVEWLDSEEKRQASLQRTHKHWYP
jgi:hypothetical protein